METLYDLDKIKVRISHFVDMIIYNDALAFGFRNKKGEPNINGFLNKLLPTLFDRRRARSMALYDEIMATCQQVTADDVGKIQDIVDRVVDKVYFPDAELGVLEKEIWIRPTKKTCLAFMEMAMEAPIVDSGFSTYLRSLLNEYCKLPQYKRELLAFDEEFQTLLDSLYHNNQICILTPEGKMCGFPVNYVYGCGYDQKTYIFLFNFDGDTIECVPLKDVRNILVTSIVCSIPDYVDRRMQEIYDQRLFLEETSFPVTPREENT